MTKKDIKFIFEEIKRKAGLDFALTKGNCCNNCTWDEINDDFGEQAKGIWLKWFSAGINKSKWNENGPWYVAHDLTPKQKIIVYDILLQHFDVEWENLSDNMSIKIKEKKK